MRLPQIISSSKPSLEKTNESPTLSFRVKTARNVDASRRLDIGKFNDAKNQSAVRSKNKKAKSAKRPAPQPALAQLVKEANTPEYLNRKKGSKVTIIDSIDSFARKATHDKGPAPQPPKVELAQLVREANTPEYLNQKKGSEVTIIDSDGVARKMPHNKGPVPQPPKTPK
ncbi:hypothetical protein ACODM8_10330 [Vibrio ostreicida]|uniref:hypothetical protein n=1 Tax=Vibrio ostreicida TaxID=526588 RepID=UPI003B59999A